MQEATLVYNVTDADYSSFEQRVLAERRHHPEHSHLRAKSILHVAIKVGPTGVTREVTVLFTEE